MPRKELFSLDWPKGGLVKDTSFTEQPDGTTFECLNVRNYDSIEQRNRGGQRTGTQKVFAAQGGSGKIQNLTQITEAVELTVDAGFGNKFADPGTVLADDCMTVAMHPDGDRVAVGGQGYVSIYEWDNTTGWGSRESTQGLGVGKARWLRWSPDGSYLLRTASESVDDDLHVAPYTKGTGLGSEVVFDLSNNGLGSSTPSAAAAWHPDGDVIIFASSVNGTQRDISAVEFTGGAFGSVIDTSANAGGKISSLAVNSTGTNVAVTTSATSDPDAMRVVSFDKTAGFGTFNAPPSVSGGGTNACAWAVDDSGVFVVTDYASSSDNKLFFFPVTGSSPGAPSGVRYDAGAFTDGKSVKPSPDGKFVLVGITASPGVIAFPWNGAFGSRLSDISSSGDGPTFGVEWNNEGTVVFHTDFESPFVWAHEFQPAEVNPSARKTRLAVVQGGSVYRSDTALTTLSLSNGGSGVLSSGRRVNADVAFQKLFFADGLADSYHYLDFADNTVKDWASDVTDGSLPVGTSNSDLGCRIITVYRGRVVLAGLVEEPQNWFMSKSGDPFDWDFSPSTTSAIQAVAGNNSDVGELGDVLTALAPYQDDVMLMGGVSSLWIMRGDPAAGGAIDNISRRIGIVGPNAWAFDPAGTFYFFGENGLYRMAPSGGIPELISKNRLDSVFANVDVDKNEVLLSYDIRWQGIHIFITPLDQPTTPLTHYFWDERNDAFWPDQYPLAHGPLSVTFFDANGPGDKALFMGGYDGFIRKFVDQAVDDDGTAINAFVRFPPINPGGIFASSRLDDIHILTDEGSADTTFKLFAGHSVEAAGDQAEAGTPAYKRILRPGRNTPIRIRVAHNAFIPELSNDAAGETWAYEKGGGTLAVLDRIRGRKVS